MQLNKIKKSPPPTPTNFDIFLCIKISPNMIQNYPFKVPILQHINEWGSSSNKTSKIALTAHVLIAMDKTAPALTGNVEIDR